MSMLAVLAAVLVAVYALWSLRRPADAVARPPATKRAVARSALAALALALVGAAGAALEIVTDVMRDSTTSAKGPWGVLPGWEPLVVVVGGALLLGLVSLVRTTGGSAPARGRGIALAAVLLGAVAVLLLLRG